MAQCSVSEARWPGGAHADEAVRAGRRGWQPRRTASTEHATPNVRYFTCSLLYTHHDGLAAVASRPPSSVSLPPVTFCIAVCRQRHPHPKVGPSSDPGDDRLSKRRFESSVSRHYVGLHPEAHSFVTDIHAIDIHENRFEDSTFPWTFVNSQTT